MLRKVAKCFVRVGCFVRVRASYVRGCILLDYWHRMCLLQITLTLPSDPTYNHKTLRLSYTSVILQAYQQHTPNRLQPHRILLGLINKNKINNGFNFLIKLIYLFTEHYFPFLYTDNLYSTLSLKAIHMNTGCL